MHFFASEIIKNIGNFFRGFARDIASGWLLFGSPLDIVLMVLDIVVSTAVIYFVLKLMSDSRAWQLLKGLIFIFAFTLICNILGLQTINYVLSYSLSILAIGFIVIFQPELRRALETVGRRSVRFLDAFSAESEENDTLIHNEIEAIVVACERMASVKTGALIIIERKTRLGELIQGTAIVVDAAITSTFIEQMFYKGSPLHDGAALIRAGRVYAARCHIPLADTYHMRRDFGTRHRAAVGASEIGDAVSVVVSEERGQISLAVGGRLYPMESGDSLRVALHRLLLPGEKVKPRHGIRSLFHHVAEQPETTVDGVPIPKAKSNQPRLRHRLFLQLISLIIAFSLWAYVQQTSNPIKEKSIQSVPLQINGVDKLTSNGLSYTGWRSDNTVNVRFEARSKNIDRISNLNVVAEIDFSSLDLAQIKKDFERTNPHKVELMPVEVRVLGLGSGAYNILVREPSTVMVYLSPKE